MAVDIITAAVLVCGAEVLLMTEPDELPENNAPYRLCGYFTYRGDGSQPVCTTPDKESAFLMGLALPAFVDFVAKVTGERIAKHADVAMLERLAALPDTRDQT
jgi:hypothetical protein